MVVKTNKTWHIELDEADAIALRGALDILLARVDHPLGMNEETEAAFDVAFRLKVNLPNKGMETVRSGGGWTPPAGPK